jgi:hypothetical protein
MRVIICTIQQMKDNGKGATCSTHAADYNGMQNCSEKLEDHLGNLDIHGRIIVNLILQKKKNGLWVCGWNLGGSG